MAYAALLSLRRTIAGFIHSSRISVDSMTRKILEYTYVKASSLESTLECCTEGVGDMDMFEQIVLIEEAHKLEDAIEFPISTHFLVDGCSPTFSFDIDHATQDVICFVKTAIKMKENIEELWEQKVRRMIEEDIKELFVQKTQKEEEEEEEDCSYSSPTDHMVGLSDQFRIIRDYLTTARKTDKMVIWISGMAGIGKTTLAKTIFHHPSVIANFECRAFVRVGQHFRLKEVLQAIIAQLNLDNQKMIMEGDEDVYECFLRILAVRKKSLIVLDDVWEDTIIFDLIRETDIIKDWGSRILVTSRENNYDVYNFKMRFLNEEESWEVLKGKVFAEEECPKELVEAGKKIADKCGGLPLLINAVADQLIISEAHKTPESWNRVADKPNSVLEDACDQISEVLLSSYHPMSENQKLRFLYFVAFPLNYIVWCSRIANLWFVEAFLRITETPQIDALDSLLRKNLVIGYEKSWYSVNITEACRLHCAYWYVSKRLAKDNKFLYVINSYADGLDECVESHRRLAIHSNVLLAIKEVHNNIASISMVRSLLCTGPYHQYQVPMCWEWKLLRVLHALTMRFYEFPVEVVKLVLLRYLALTCNANLPPSISKLWNLQFLIVNQHLSIKRVAAESYVPLEIWDMKELIHLQIMGRNLPDPPPGAVLPKLEKLLDVGVESCTTRVLESMPNLLKLRIQIDLEPDAAETLSFFHHISCLHKLRYFVSVIMNPTLLCPPPPLSISAAHIIKLSLSGFGYSWEDMSKIAELPDLEVLKLQCYAFRGEKWDAKETRFSGLTYLLIEDTDLVQWTAADETFPQLYSLEMKNCHKLQQIPRISYMHSVELVDCNPLAEACAKQRYDAKSVEVIASYSWKDKKLKS